MNPLQQGLKPITGLYPNMVSIVAIMNPLQQGLKHIITIKE